VCVCVCVCVCVLLWEVQSVNKGTSNETLSMFCRCGLTFSIPFGSLAWKNKNQVISIYVKSVCECVHVCAYSLSISLKIIPTSWSQQRKQLLRRSI